MHALKFYSQPISSFLSGNKTTWTPVTKLLLDVAPELVDEWIAPALVEPHLPFGTTMLHVFAGEHNWQVCTLLIKAGADPTKSDGDGNSALHCAVGESKAFTRNNRNQALVAALLASKASNIDVRNGEDETALHMAVSYSSKSTLRLVRSLLNAGTDANARRPKHSCPALHRALRIGDADRRRKVVALLVGLGKADVDAKDKEGRSALYAVAVEDVLVGAGANNQARNESGETPRDVFLRLLENTAAPKRNTK